MKSVNTFRKAADFLRNITESEDVGMLVTTNAKGRPHACWMGTVGQKDLSKITTMTASNTRKVQNIYDNPKVEWVFSDSGKETIVYLSGTARVITDTEEIKNQMQDLYDMTKAYFLNYMVGNATFVVIETAVEEIEYTVPSRNIYETVSLLAGMPA